MRKSNKIMFKAVAILLSLVLLTSCVVSTTFAKYVIRKSAPLTVGLERFGVSIDLDVNEAFANAVGTDNVEITQLGESLSVKISNLKLAPGDDFSDAIVFNFSGTAGTRVRFNIDVNVDFDTADFTVPAGVGKLTEATCFFPLGFTRDYDAYLYGNLLDIASGEGPVVIKPWSSINYSNYISEGILHKLYSDDFVSTDYITYEDVFDLTVTGSNKDDGSKDISLEKIFEDGDDVYLNAWSWYQDDVCIEKTSVNNLKFGFYMPYDIDTTDDSYDSSLDYIAIENYLLNKLSEENTNFSMSFTISVEQVSSSYTIPPMTWTEAE